MNNEERDSQLSAMFDDELPAGECEFMARRLARDPALQGRWGRYAVIGACLKGQAGVRLPGHDSVADHVRAALGGEPLHGVPAVEQPQSGAGRPAARWLMPLGMVGSAAAVAAFAIVWMRTQAPAALVAQAPAPVVTPAPQPPQVAPPPALVAQAAAAPQALPTADVLAPRDSAPRLRTRERDSYVLPPPTLNAPMVLLPTRDANYQGSPAQYQGPVR